MNFKLLTIYQFMHEGVSPTNNTGEDNIKLGVLFADVVENLFDNGVLGTHVFE